MYRPTGGAVRFNDDPQLNTALVNPESAFALQFQTGSLFPFTVGENITLRSGAMPQNLTLTDQGGTVLTKLLGRGMTTQFEEKGGFLSGGQIQRVMLERAFALGRDWLIFDEPFNNLDQEAKIAFAKTLATLPQSVLIISHDRIPGVTFDQVIDLGKVNRTQT